MVERLRTAQAEALRRAMLEARHALDQADATYQKAFEAVMSANAGLNSLATLRRDGRAYAQALAGYSTAAMAWLTYVDQQLRPEKADSAG